MKEESQAKKIKLTDSGDGLNAKVARQVEYYFSDVNVIKDKFMQEQFQKDDGWVKLSVLLTFARLKEMTQEEERVIEALKSHDSEIIELDATKHQVRRRNPVPDLAEYQKQLDARTVHISGFPNDYTFDPLHRFCSQFGEVDSLQMRKYFKTKLFKGCIHVVFKREEDAKKVLDTEILKCKDRELKKESMDAYHKRKEAFRLNRKARSKKTEK